MRKQSFFDCAGTAGAIGGAFVGFKAKEHNNKLLDGHTKQQ